ncbi:helix-turn-helix transcriptional regulator [Lysinibacillus xylanilyticus]|uniref:helix-turn-helix transcriptional regulator n=1 Tax=Lysinibacillus xylanilyticus TaxID=582475 RepID=UPI00382857B3
MEKRNQFSKVIGHELKSVRDKMNLSMTEMGKLLSVSHQTINLYEKGQRIPSMKALKSYSEKCDADYQELFQLRVRCIKESHDVLDEDANVNLKNEYELIMHYEELLKQGCKKIVLHKGENDMKELYLSMSAEEVGQNFQRGNFITLNKETVFENKFLTVVLYTVVLLGGHEFQFTETTIIEGLKKSYSEMSQIR